MDAGRKKTGDGPVGPKKQLGVYLPRADWLRLRDYAAVRRVPITHLLLERLTVVETCHRQRRNSSEYVTDAVTAHFTGQPVPSLLGGV